LIPLRQSLDSREDHSERRQTAAQVIEAEDHVADSIEQRLDALDETAAELAPPRLIVDRKIR